MPYLLGIPVAVLIGFLAGLFSFKVKSRWCPTHGWTLRCPECTGTLAQTGWITKSR